MWSTQTPLFGKGEQASCLAYCWVGPPLGNSISIDAFGEKLQGNLLGEKIPGSPSYRTYRSYKSYRSYKTRSKNPAPPKKRIGQAKPIPRSLADHQRSMRTTALSRLGRLTCWRDVHRQAW